MADTTDLGRVLVTGISGFVGGHVALELLQQGFSVRGSVRNLAKAEGVRQTLAEAGADVARLEFVALDLLDDAGWDEAALGCRYLAHTASPFLIDTPKDPEVLVRPAVDGTRRAIGAALKAKVERVVLTSSIAAIQYGHKTYDRLLDASDWTQLDGKDVGAYARSKTLAEHEAWEMMEAAGRRADLVTINPGVIFGPLLNEDIGVSPVIVQRLLNGTVPAAPRIALGIVDVRDVAAAHVAALLAPDAGGQRFIAVEDSLSFLEIAQALRTALPDQSGRVPRIEVPDWMIKLYLLFDRKLAGNVGELGVTRRFASGAIEGLLGQKLIPARTAAVATAESLLGRGLV